MTSSPVKAALRLAVSVSLLSSCLAAQPNILKIEPPNWWAGLPGPMLLLTGEGLADAKVSTAYPGVNVRVVTPTKDGRYLFVELETGATALPGEIPFHVQTADGSARFTMPFLARPDQAGRYQGLSPDDVIYLIMPDRFADGDPTNNHPPGSTGVYNRDLPRAYHGGDLKGVHDRLPYLNDLGVTAIWLTPIVDNSESDYHGYHTTEFYSVDERMGSLRDYQEFVARAHQLGMKVVFDFVVNHIGPSHRWVAAPPTPTWIHGTQESHLEPRYTFAPLVDPHATPSLRAGTLQGWFAGRLPDLNVDDPLLGRYLLQNAIWWAEIAGLDAYRLDTFPYSPRGFWDRWHNGLFAVYPRLFTLAEAWDSDPSITAFFEGGRARWDGIDSRASTVFDFPLSFAMRDVTLGRKPATRLAEVLSRDWLYLRPQQLVTFIGNHDTRRFMSEPGASPEALHDAFGLLLTMRGIPQIYAGDEIAMRGGDDPDNRRDFPGGFAGDQRNAFSRTGRTPEESIIFKYVQSLLVLRRKHPALRKGRHLHVSADESWYAFVREHEGERLLVIYSREKIAASLPMAGTPLETASMLERISGLAEAAIQGDRLALQLRRGVTIYLVK